MKKVVYILMLVLFSCKSEEKIPDEIIPQKEFTHLLFQVQLMESYCQNKYVRPDLYKDILHKSVDSLLTLEGYSEEEYKTSFEYYTHRPKLMFTIYEAVLDSMNVMQVKVNAVQE